MDEAVIKKIMPHNLQAEQSVVGAMMMDKDAVMVASEILSPEDFYARQYGLLFEAMCTLYQESKAIDLITIKDRLSTMNVPDELKNDEFLKETLVSVPTSANVKHYADIVKDKAMLRKLIKTSEDISRDCYAGTDTVENILDLTEQRVFKLLQSKSVDDFEPISDIVIRTIQKIELAAKKGGGITGIPTGYPDLDYKTAGLQNSDLILIAARPSMGKTAFALNLAEHVCFDSGIPTAIFSLEMPKEQLINRLIAQRGKVKAQNIRTGQLSENDWENIIEASNVIGSSNLIIDDTTGITVSEMRSKCRKYKMEHNIGLIVIDYLQLMGSSGRADSRTQEVAEISKALKGIARELNVPVIALSQLSRAPEQRPDHRPMLSDLRESGAIEQDADVAMFLYRDDYYHPDTQEKGVTEVIIAKQRNGPVCTVKLLWLAEFTKFGSIEYSKTQQ